MCLKPQPPHPIPGATAALVHDLFHEGLIYLLIGDVLFDQFHGEDFDDLYLNDEQSELRRC